MKKLFLFLAACATIGVGSAFTAKMTTPPTLGTYLLVDGEWRPASEFPEADCITNPQVCSYNKIGDELGEMDNPLTNPENFEDADHGTPVLNP
jgi:hypothetical protein